MSSEKNLTIFIIDKKRIFFKKTSQFTLYQRKRFFK